jgi:hypothetical protein
MTKVRIMNAGKLRNFNSLNNLPMPREVRLIECRLSPADLRAISALPGRLDVSTGT